MNVLLALLVLVGWIFHPRRGEKYHRVNSLRGIRRAKKAGATEVDIDLCITADKRIVGNHWRRPRLKDGFRDPLGRIRLRACIDQLTFRRAHRLVAGLGYRIQSIEVLLKECARVGIIARVEPKGDPRFTQDWPWQHIKAVAEDVGCEVRMYVLRNSPVRGYGERVQPVAERNGIPGKVIH